MEIKRACISVLQWNILDPDFSTKNDFPQIDESVLSWPVRKVKIAKTVKELNPDIICMEEVKSETSIPVEGYEKIFLEKKALSHGLFVCYRQGLFERLDYHYEQFKTDEEVQSQNFIYLKLKHIPSQSEINLVVTHLKSKRFFEVRLNSVRQMLKFLKTRNIKRNMFIVGDFNAEENEESIQMLSQETGLRSIRPGKFTTLKMNRLNNMTLIKRKIDYIFYDDKSFDLSADWSLNNEVENIPEGCPSAQCPSDHLPLFASFELILPSTEIKPNL